MINLPSISFAITACNEELELNRLLDQLTTLVIKDDDEIVLQLDQDSHTPGVLDIAKRYKSKFKNFKFITFPLNKDFATFKNNLISKCKKDYIFQIDADEELGVFLWDIKSILSENPNIDLFLLPRINTVSDMPLDYVHENNWQLDHVNTYNGLPIINWPDPQPRIFKNAKHIRYKNAVHERIVGHKNFTLLVGDVYTNVDANRKFALIHEKSFNRQKMQNDFYKTLIDQK